MYDADEIEELEDLTNKMIERGAKESCPILGPFFSTYENFFKLFFGQLAFFGS